MPLKPYILAERFLGLKENSREVDLDMREMVDKVKRGEPLYGKSTLSEDQQGMAARNSRFSFMFLSVLPWANLVNHPYHGVDTAKYYRQAERELEEERVKREGS
jgi:NADH-ubiquinone oxidoreductase subunit